MVRRGLRLCSVELLFAVRVLYGLCAAAMRGLYGLLLLSAMHGLYGLLLSSAMRGLYGLGAFGRRAAMRGLYGLLLLSAMLGLYGLDAIGCRAAMRGLYGLVLLVGTPGCWSTCPMMVLFSDRYRVQLLRRWRVPSGLAVSWALAV